MLKPRVRIPKVSKVGNLECEVVVFSKKCALFRRKSPSGTVLSYDLFMLDKDTVNEHGYLKYPELDMFTSPFHTANRIYAVSGYKDRPNEDFAIAEHRVFVRSMRKFEEYNQEI